MNAAPADRVFQQQTPPDGPDEVQVQRLSLLISKQGFLAEYFPQSYSGAVPPAGPALAHSRVYVTTIAFYKVLFFFLHFYSFLFSPSSCPTQAQLQVHHTGISSVTGELSWDEQVTAK